MSKTMQDMNYLDPRWQKKRLEILQRDKFTCRNCQNATETLHIHHRYYVKNRDSWEYPNFSLITLCRSCHESECDPCMHEYDMATWEKAIERLSFLDVDDFESLDDLSLSVEAAFNSGVMWGDILCSVAPGPSK